MKLKAQQDELRGEVELYEEGSFTDSSEHLTIVPIFLCIQYKPSLTTLESGNDDPNISCHQHEVLQGIKILRFTDEKRKQI